MVMSKDEIIREYRTAKDQKVQIGILADLNCCSKDEIIEVLVNAGESIGRGRRKKKAEAKTPSRTMPEEITRAAFRLLDELEEDIKAKRRECRMIEQIIAKDEERYKQLAEFVSTIA